MRTEKGILVLLAASVDAHVWQVILLSSFFFIENNNRGMEFRFTDAVLSINNVC